MGIAVQELCTCDLCGAECSKYDMKFDIDINVGCRDVGATQIKCKLDLYIPYGPTNALVCKSCQKKYLQKYIDSLVEND
jgi:hypothetical protein